jgi:hypothetical protein
MVARAGIALLVGSLWLYKQRGAVVEGCGGVCRHGLYAAPSLLLGHSTAKTAVFRCSQVSRNVAGLGVKQLPR